MSTYIEEVKVLSKRGELSLGAGFSKKPVIVRTHENGIIEIIPAEIKASISEDEVEKAYARFTKDHSETNQLLKHG